MVVGLRATQQKVPRNLLLSKRKVATNGGPAVTLENGSRQISSATCCGRRFTSKSRNIFSKITLPSWLSSTLSVGSNLTGCRLGLETPHRRGHSELGRSFLSTFTI
ncbi:unnamed protein product [Protopolystoma xenopodis]|uniref:Uncharacterized protein n=1 Tax=Protopolystoma xenopodis TaxID=117903 RepID=A0A3S5CQH7_9PLAT|nr:unnamed protein product [Protopolystoma xenopodis]